MSGTGLTIGVGLTTTFIVLAFDTQLPCTDVYITLYNPVAAVVALLIIGFSIESLNPFGPLQL